MMTTLAAGSFFWIAVLYFLEGHTESSDGAGRDAYCRLECVEPVHYSGGMPRTDFEQTVMNAYAHSGAKIIGGGINA